MLTRILDKLKFSPKKTPATPVSKENKSQIPPQANLLQIPEWKPGDTILDRYNVEEVFSGAMGRVYIAEHLGWKLQVAIKVPKVEVLADKEGAKRILSEADNWVRMGMHPNVATCYYVLNVDKIPHLFIEFVDGGDLSTWLKSGRCKDLRTILSLAVQFCHGMEFTHSRGIIHRDIKPQNILLTKNALLKITDFGIIQTVPSDALGLNGKKLQGKNKDADNDLTVGFRGTPGFASPEQFADTHAVDKRTDIFSFGICLWLMLCGRKPYKHNSIQEDLVPSSIRGRADFSSGLVQLLKKVVAFAPKDRYQNFTSLRKALNQVYKEIFKVQCPYMVLDFDDLQAENFNNRAVSLLELGRVQEGAVCLNKSLEMNDTLAEGIYNFSLLKWKNGKTKTDHILRQLEAARQRLPDSKILDALAQSVKCDILGRTWQDDTMPENGTPSKVFYPEYMLCIPKNSLDVFRSGQIHRSTQENVVDLLAKKRYESCYKVLIKAWGNIGFRKDKVFIETYSKLLTFADKGKLLGVIRLANIAGPASSGSSVCYLPGTKKIMSVANNGKVVIRHYGSHKKIHVLEKHKDVLVTALSPDGVYLALGGKKGLVEILSIKNGRKIKEFKSDEAVHSLAFTPDSKCITSGSITGRIQTNSLSTGKEKLAQVKEGGAVRSITYFEKNRDFVTGSDDGNLRFWSSGGKECIRIVEAHAMPITSLATSENGLLFISASADRFVKIWDRQTGQCMKSIEAHDDAISSVSMLAGNNYFVSGCEDDIIKIWQIDSGECCLVLDGRGDGIKSLAAGPKPHMFLSGRRDGAVIAWMVIYELGFF